MQQKQEAESSLMPKAWKTYSYTETEDWVLLASS